LLYALTNSTISLITPCMLFCPDPSEDYEYVVVCPPHQMETNIEDTSCEISITAAKENALVNIRYE
jgi:hypothetical protein